MTPYFNFKRFFELRGRLFDLIRKVDDGYHKSYEGALDVMLSFPNIYESDGNPECEWLCWIELGCYLLIEDGRHKKFHGETFDECLDQFEEWLTKRENDFTNGGAH